MITHMFLTKPYNFLPFEFSEWQKLTKNQHNTTSRIFASTNISSQDVILACVAVFSVSS